jgi:hypothetical protein
MTPLLLTLVLLVEFLANVKSNVVADGVDGEMPYNLPSEYESGENILIPIY